MILALALAAALCCPDRDRAGDKVAVRWQAKTGTSDALPAGFPEPARATLAVWEPFLKKADYRADADSSGRLLLFSSEKTSHADEQLRQLAKVQTWMDGHFPAQADAAAPKSDGAPKPESSCAAVFVLRNPDDYSLLLAHVRDVAPNLAGWTDDARKETGFVLFEPLCAAYLESAPGQAEWSPVHELVNRAAQLLLVQRHGVQPCWLQLGAAWAAEWAYDGNLFCFPYRHEFVFAAEHGAWPGSLKRDFGKRAGKPLAMSEFASMRRGSWDPERAQLAFGCASFLALQPADKLAQALADLQAYRDENNRVDKDDGTWVSDLNYEIPPDKQLELLEARLGPKLLERAAAFLAKGNDSFRALARP
jgi:hypothetical protein